MGVGCALTASKLAQETHEWPFAHIGLNQAHEVSEDLSFSPPNLRDLLPRYDGRFCLGS